MWNTFRIYIQRRVARHWRATAVSFTGLALLIAAGLVVTGLAGGSASHEGDKTVAQQREVPAASVSRPTPPPAAALRSAPDSGARTQQERTVSGVPAKAARVASGRHLSANRTLVLTKSGRAQLTGGRVDDRVMRALSSLLTNHSIRVASFTGSSAVPLRGMLINRVDSVAVQTGGRHTMAATAVLRGLAGRFRPAGLRVTEWHGFTVLEVRYR